ncbi:MAG: tetraacyldisaccharide 4'-kinase [Pseudomonadota bacterium]
MHAPEFWADDGAVAHLLDPIGRLYGALGAFRRRLATPTRVSVPVICIGNLTVGGAGKTPAAIAIARHLQGQGERPHFLTRGYGGRERGPLQVDPDSHGADEVGDEPLLLARTATTWVSADRVAGAKAAIAAGTSHIVMDDGLQNPYLEKDLRLLVIDGATGFGNRRVLPAGPLREPLDQAFARIDAAIVIGEDRAGVDGLLPVMLPRLAADVVPDADLDQFRGRSVLAFAGIGRPEKFYATLRALGAEIAETRSFSDHHRYQPREIEHLLTRARQFDAVCVTTEKDHVRIPPNLGKLVEKLPVRLRFHQPKSLDQLLSTYLSNHAAAAK